MLSTIKMLKNHVGFGRSNVKMTKAGLSDEITGLRAVSKSLLMCMEKSESELIKYLTGTVVTNEPQLIGNAIHTAILEPEHLSRFSCFHFTKIFKSDELPWTKKHLICYHKLSEAILLAQKHNLGSFTHTAYVLGVEQLFWGTFEYLENTFALKGYVDVMAFDYVTKTFNLIDVKTTSTINEANLLKSIRTYGYDLQMFIYSLAFFKKYGVKPKCELLFISKSMPYESYLYTITDADLASGKKRFYKNLNLVSSFAKRNKHYKLSVMHVLKQ